MSPVHVLVSEDPADEQAWAQAFAGAVDLYRFGRNAEAFERLTAAAAPIDLVVLTPNQGGPFNLTADQLVARVVDSPIGNGTGPLASLYVVVVGEQARSTNPRVACVSSLDAAIRLIKFGELERAPRPTVPASSVELRPDVDRELARLGGFDIDAGPAPLDDSSMFASSVISRIWDAGDQAALDAKRLLARREQPTGGRAVEGGGPQGQRPTPRSQQARQQRQQQAAPPGAIQRGSAAQLTAPAPPQQRVSSSMQLFANQPPHPASLTAARLARPAGPGMQAQPSLAMQPQPVVGGGAAMAHHAEQIEVGSGMALLPARQYELQAPGYRGPAVRGGNLAGHAPIPPALVQQVHSMVYPAQGAVADPMLTWSGSSSGTVTTQAVPVPQGGIAPMPVQRVTAPQPTVVMPQHPHHAPMAQPQPRAISTDPLMRRAEGDGAVQFG